MNKTVTFALASLLAVSPVAGVAYAQDVMPTTPDTMSTGSIGADNVQVIYLSALENDDSQASTFAMLSSKVNDPAALEQAQAEIQSEPGLADALVSKNVQLQNVVHVQTAGNGGKIVYVK
ncbi:hypothetical protein [Shinella pollutisoli]|uniref:Uncharacterized protein n=1 Tax=Shinella pollutisoli TaxID=2250594 RepID=A0ABV7DPQ0_9HYPH|nr:hypothetical protein [Shinella pollutisoli]